LTDYLTYYPFYTYGNILKGQNYSIVLPTNKFISFLGFSTR